MNLIQKIVDNHAALTAIRQDLHAHPELGFEEVRTSGIVADLLEKWGIETHRAIGKTGVVGVIKGKGAGRVIGLRADMDALPIEEQSNLPFSSQNPGVMHACGHDGHTTMLLGAAQYLAETRDFDGTVIVVFQPAEEGLGGARAMLADGLFERFACDEIYGLHNYPGAPQNQIGIVPGVAMAGADFFDITLTGKGSHAARPQDSHDPILAASALVQALQSVVSRNLNPQDAAVVSVTQFHSGAAYNVIPGDAVISGTARMFTDAVRHEIRERITAIANGIAATHNCEAHVDIKDIFTPLVNSEAHSDVVANIARDVVGADMVKTDGRPVTGSEDFADMLLKVPGAYFTIGHEGTGALHNSGFSFDDAIIPLGATMLARTAQQRLSA